MRFLGLSIYLSAIALGVIALASPPDYGIVIGIDLGTTYSCVAVYQGGRVDIIPNEQGNRITPSWVAFTESERLIGDTAKQAFHKNPGQTIFDTKRLLGRQYDELLREDIRHWPFQVVNTYGRPSVEVIFQGSLKVFTPQEISAMILGKLKETAEAYLGRRVTHAVITVPAYFNDEQRQATKDAGHIAGLNVLRMINEPTAAAIAYGLDKKGGKQSTMIVYDLGGGTFDVSLLRVNDSIFEVLATAGDTHLGGEDFDNRVIDYFVARYEKETGRNISKNGRAMSKLKREVEKAKRTLSSQITAKLEIESFEGGNDFSAILTRAKFEELNLDLFRRTLAPVAKVLQDANVGPKGVDDVILVGGSTRIPAVRQLLKDYFQGVEPRMGINPDEAVAYGAAIQASVLAGATPFNDMVLIDVCPFTLGIKTTGGVFSQLIARNTPIPVQRSEIFSTATDNQQTVLIQVLQGDNPLAKDNIVLGTFKLTGIPPSARGVPQINVTFAMDANGILTVLAHDRDSGSARSITITSEKNQLARRDIDRMMYEAEVFTQSDQEVHARATALNDLQERIASKRAELKTLDPDASNIMAHLLIAHFSNWVEVFGESASLADVKQQILDIDQVVFDYEGLSVKHDIITPSLDVSSLNVHQAPARGVDLLENSTMPVATSSVNVMVPFLRDEL
ncbi:heat shock protein HSP70 family protein [Ceratobasidium sp. AG-Ba]|nr:heat shock protein HSP70 family protein [Ceratobasidium sp. AG-Ba]QRV99229.1 heat shock protein HSP70 family protein [Ceratobasidium sp. AG-Ba]QRW13726.1 heat shock protein HSP70 family protein [Ceratobasidium sp. AG-Ba]